MKKNITALSVFILLTAFLSCKDFIEDDISKKTVQLLAPSDGYASDVLTVTFWWSEVDGAEQYKLTVVKPSFSSLQQFILDTIVTSDRFNFTLPSPGNYQWRVKAMNNGSETSYSTYSFSVDSVLDLSSQQVALALPQANYLTHDTEITFSWSALYNATNYRFQLIDQSSSLLVDSLLSTTQLTLFLTEGGFTWQVRAESNSTASPYSARSITVDLTAPSAPVPDSPAYGDTVSTPVSMSWQSDPTSFEDSLFIYSDSLMNNRVIAVSTSTSTYLYSAAIQQVYYWRLKSIDAIGNESGYSTVSKFYVQ